MAGDLELLRDSSTIFR